MSVKSVITALADQVRRLSGKTVSLSLETMTDALGAIVNNGTVSPSQLSAGESYTIPKGLHSGSGKVTAKSLSDQTTATAAEGNILYGKTAYVNGSKITGTMKDNGAVAPSAIDAGGSYTIPAGYHNGQGKVSAKSLADQTDGTAAAGDILSGKTAYVDGVKVTGSMTDQGTKTASLNTTTTSYTIPAGKHSGSGKVSITTQEKSVTPSTSAQTVTPDSGKVLSKVSVGAVASVTQATPTITVDSAGKITASATQTAGYVSAGTKSATKQMTTKGAATITPGTSNQTIAAGMYLTGVQTIKGDANLKAANIKSGVSIFGVSGSYTAAASGKQVYTGTVTASSKQTLSINTGVALASGDTFILLYNGSSYSGLDMYEENIGLTAIKTSSGSKVIVVDSAGDYEDEMSYPEIVVGGTVSYIGSTVTVTCPSYTYFRRLSYAWYLIK